MSTNDPVLVRRNERARALGFTSYGQQRRAKTEGYTSAGQYQTAVAVRGNQRTVARALAAGNLLGGTATRTGVVLSASFADEKSMKDQWRAIRRFGATRRVTLDLETGIGNIYHLGQKAGGYRIDYLRALVKAMEAEHNRNLPLKQRWRANSGESWQAAVAALLAIVIEMSYDENDDSAIDVVTATIV